MKKLNHFQKKLKHHKKWRATNNIYGHEPKFNIICAYCGDDMVLRHSVIHAFENVMSYKCPSCSWFIRFRVFWDEEYLAGILDKFRHGEDFFIPIEDFMGNEIIKQRLADLGYW